VIIRGYAQSEPYDDQFLDQFVVEKDRMLANAEELSIELEAVIFADGALSSHSKFGEGSNGIGL